MTDNTPIKYHLGMWKSLPSYPTETDFLFEVISYLEKNSKTGEFTELTLNSIVNPKWKETHEKVFLKLIESGKIIAIERKDKMIYQVKDNPFL
jgi:hypothetical protein